MDDPLTYLDFDPDLWLEVRSSGGLDRSHAYELSNTKTEKLWMTCNASTVWILAIDSKHSNSRVCDNVRPTSTDSDDPS